MKNKLRVDSPKFRVFIYYLRDISGAWKQVSSHTMREATDMRRVHLNQDYDVTEIVEYTCRAMELKIERSSSR